ncbi:DUF1304 family protein [Streptomyces sp. SID625]|nr:DUF1304 family protein [Streptomyces sp. SID625]
MVGIPIAGAVLVWLNACVHLLIMGVEMFLWTVPRARGSFGTTAEFAGRTKTLAAGQGLCNGFLARVFFLACVALAGLYGAATSSRKILFVQTVPAAAGLALVLLAH